ncbi:MAG: DUF5706 domain-containing protein [Flavobacteriaceae bacterium]|nr:DUF5706 domain-containing protein [Flavobacteriaceae bacterium]
MCSSEAFDNHPNSTETSNKATEDPSFKLSDQSIQTFFYTAIRNHVDLAEIADKKANTLMGVSILLLSIIILGIFRNWDTMPTDLRLSIVFVLVLSNIATIVLSIFSTRPIIEKTQITKEDLIKGDINLAFFQNFTHLELEDFSWAVDAMKKDKKKVISVLTKDLYFLGKSLSNKYNWVSRAYNVFLIGIVMTILLILYSILKNG